jgi:hypothetical protein
MVPRPIFWVLQLGALACIVAAVFFISGPIVGTAVSGSACAALLALSVPSQEKKVRVVQVLAASTSLVVAVMLIFGSHDERRVPTTASAEAARHPALSPAATHVPAKSGAQTAEAVVPHTVGEVQAVPQVVAESRSPMAKDLAGVDLPDLGDGKPFEAVAMTQQEMDTFVRLYVRFWDTQKKLQAAVASKSLSHDEYLQKLQELGDESTAELESVMGAERVGILTQELARYLSRMQMEIANGNAQAVQFSAKDMESVLVKALQPLVTDQKVP